MIQGESHNDFNQYSGGRNAAYVIYKNTVLK